MKFPVRILALGAALASAAVVDASTSSFAAGQSPVAGGAASPPPPLDVSFSTTDASFPLDVSFNTTDASFTILVGGAPWFSSATYAIRSNGTWFSSENGTLSLAAPPVPVSGQGPYGNFTGFTATWDAPASPGIWETSFYLYPSIGAVVFEQSFPLGLGGTALHSLASNDVCTAFPTWGPQKALLDSDLAYLTFDGGHSPPHVGRWTAAGTYRASTQGGAVTTWYNASGFSLVLSPLTNVETQRGLFSPELGDVFAQGFNGALSSIPAGLRAQSVMVARPNVNDTMYAWGDMMLQAGGKARTPLTGDLATSRIAAWTDNGAYFYHSHLPNVTYEQTIIDYIAYLTGPGVNLPIASIQYDSWWYYERPSDQALILWEPMGSVFPDGFGPWLKMMPLVLHSRYFADQNNYTEMGIFDFLVHSPLSLPIDKNLFLYIFSKAKVGGLTMYEQDWHNRVWDGIPALQSNLTAAHSWLHAMGDAASELSLTIQYCLVVPSTVLASASIPSVTNIRASGDYHPGDYHDSEFHWNTWDVALTSLLLGALGVQPSKDVFWTTEVQPGNPYNTSPSGDTEPNWFLHTLAATLTTGPVGLGDGIGYTNATLMMSTCRAGDGLILKPDRPAHAVGAALSAIFTMPPSTSGSYILPNVTHTYSTHGPSDGSQVWRWHYVLAVSLQGPFVLPAGDLGPAFNASAGGYQVFDFFNVGAGPLATVPGNGSGSFTIQPGQAMPSAPAGSHALRYLLVAPVLPGGWVVVGEAGKLVPMSTLRTADFTAFAATGGNGFSATVVTSASTEEVVYQVWPPGAQSLTTVTCAAGGSGKATLSCDDKSGCACA